MEKLVNCFFLHDQRQILLQICILIVVLFRLLRGIFAVLNIVVLFRLLRGIFAVLNILGYFYCCFSCQ